jgi:hypothetical protein
MLKPSVFETINVFNRAVFLNQNINILTIKILNNPSSTLCRNQ